MAKKEVNQEVVKEVQAELEKMAESGNILPQLEMSDGSKLWIVIRNKPESYLFPVSVPLNIRDVIGVDTVYISATYEPKDN